MQNRFSAEIQRSGGHIEIISCFENSILFKAAWKNTLFQYYLIHIYDFFQMAMNFWDKKYSIL